MWGGGGGGGDVLDVLESLGCGWVACWCPWPFINFKSSLSFSCKSSFISCLNFPKPRYKLMPSYWKISSLRSCFRLSMPFRNSILTSVEIFYLRLWVNSCLSASLLSLISSSNSLWVFCIDFLSDFLMLTFLVYFFHLSF